MQRAEYLRDYRARNREKARRQAVEYRRANPEKARRYRERNRESLKTKCKAWRERNRHKIRTAELARAGFTVESFEAAIAAQNGRCAICTTLFDQSIANKACADHCHATNRPRSAICCTCNLGLGHFKDDPERLRAAIAYLAKFA